MQSINPTTEAIVETVPMDSARELETKLQRAFDAFRSWRMTSFERRAELVLKLGQCLAAKSDELARMMTLEMGKPVSEARAEVTKCLTCCDYFAEGAKRFLGPEPIESDGGSSFVVYQPLGPVLAIMPWNFPVWQVIRFAAPTLMAGNTALLKHAPTVPGCARLLTECFADAGFPEGVFENLIVSHEQVPEVISDGRVAAVTLTGSVRAGRAVARLAGQAIKPTLLELGGSDPFIVLGDADLEEAAAGAVFSRFLNAGQSCIAAKRIIVEASVYDEFVATLLPRVEALRVGDPGLNETQIGPMAREDLRAELQAQVQRSVASGATLLLGGELPKSDGWFYPPTVLAGVRPGMAAFDEELFGPVAVLVRANDAEDAIELAGQTKFGLGASIWTTTERGLAFVPRLDAGCVAVNGIIKSDTRLPFGGIKESGYGRELSRAGIRAFVNAKTVWVK